jgi:hypothetical protein
MLLNEMTVESMARQYRQDRLAEAKQHRLERWLRNLRKSAGR